MSSLPSSTLLFLLLILAAHLLEMLALLLDRQQLQKPLPAQLAAWVEQETWQKSQTYSRARQTLSFWSANYQLLILLFFWFAGGFAWLEQTVQQWNQPPWLTGVLYIAVLLFGSYLSSLPFDLYATFVQEARFGFNRTSLPTWLGDQLKMLLLALLLGGPLLAALLLLLHEAGPYAWIYGWGMMTTFSLLLQWILPRWILPLFNRFEPLPAGELRQAILDYAAAIHFPVGQIFSIDGSRRSSKANAFVTGFGKHRRIALYDTLIQQHTLPELLAVLAHEVGHARHWHLLKMLLLGTLHTGILFGLLALLLPWPGLYQGFFLESMPLHAGLLFFGLVIGPIDLFAGMLFKALSRHFEYQADHFAVSSAPEQGALITALRTLAKENLSNLMPHPLSVLLHYSHPPVGQRIAAMERSLQKRTA
ncbi:M48 family metallopeptidase [Candidatus Magnetaquicoccus inordinatus]|uniref:M48 family metallopeptidase n=1 Tax=Candidatus Magnetaquicoccus inordinatus TaxID=2496818 RepID=UPI00102C1F42|nr:M48 family metallopeptidase [Candidatus Magnetaquicoccus inordinatus]